MQIAAATSAIRQLGQMKELSPTFSLVVKSLRWSKSNGYLFPLEVEASSSLVVGELRPRG